MKIGNRLSATALVLITQLGGTSLAHADCSNCRDTPFLPRYPQSNLVGYDQHAFEQASFVSGPPNNDDSETTNLLKVEGKRTQLFYWIPEGRSGLEVFANYKDAAVKAGFSAVWTCSGTDECTSKLPALTIAQMHLDFSNTAEARAGVPDADNPRYLFAKQERADGNLYAGVLVVDMPLHTPPRAGAYVVVVQEKPMDKGMQTIDANALDRSLLVQGKALVYGIHFDFDKSEIKPDSQPQIEQIAKLMQDHPGMRLRIAGYTDNVGGDDYNLALSARRADAIAAALARNHGIAPERLSAEGRGARDPVASNDTEDGRAKDRRVELTKE